MGTAATRTANSGQTAALHALRLCRAAVESAPDLVNEARGHGVGELDIADALGVSRGTLLYRYGPRGGDARAHRLRLREDADAAGRPLVPLPRAAS